MLDTSPICRVCLKTSLEYIDFETPFHDDDDPSMSPIELNPLTKHRSSEQSGFEKLTYLDCFRACTRLEVECGANLCDACGLELTITYNFLQKAASSDRILKELKDLPEPKHEILELLSDMEASDSEVDNNMEWKESCDETLYSQEAWNLNTEKNQVKLENLNSIEENDVKFYTIIHGGVNVIQEQLNEIFGEDYLYEDGQNAGTPPAEDYVEELKESPADGGTYIEEIEQSPDDAGNCIEESEQTGVENYLEKLDQNNFSYSDSYIEELESFPLGKQNAFDEEAELDVRLVDFRAEFAVSATDEPQQSTEQLEEEYVHHFEATAQGDSAMKIIEAFSVDPNSFRNVNDYEEETNESQINAQSILKQCNECSEFIAEDNYVAHVNQHILNSLQCTICFQFFDTRGTLMQHYCNAHKKRSVPCKICKNEFRTTRAMQMHAQKLHANVVQCSQCEYTDNEYKMPIHLIKEHAAEGDFLCNVCSKRFNTLGLLNSHLKNHERKEIKSDACEICGKKFASQYYIRQHMEVHANDREQFRCQLCEKVYISRAALEHHVRIHKGETLQCTVCCKQFTRSHELAVHMRFHTGDYPFECDICQKRFAIKGHLRTHMWKHDGLKLKCDKCEKLFTSTKALHEHSYFHTQMPFPCSYCQRGYPSRQKYKVHLKSVHKVILNEEELEQLRKIQQSVPLQRKKVTLVKADSSGRKVPVEIELINHNSS